MQVKLKVLVGKNAGREIPIPISRFLIGRAKDCHLRPKSEAVSRNHCAILIRQDEVIIRDLNSRNGTFVNGERISEDRPLKSGDHLQIGRLEFEVLVKAEKKVRKKKPVAAEEAAKDSDSASIDFDVTEWLEEADAAERAKKEADPDTRQFKLDETDRLKLEEEQEQAEAAGEEEKKEEKKPQEGGAKGRKWFRIEKKKPGKLPQRPITTAPSSVEAAADMLKKFFQNR